MHQITVICGYQGCHLILNSGPAGSGVMIVVTNKCIMLILSRLYSLSGFNIIGVL